MGDFMWLTPFVMGDDDDGSEDNNSAPWLSSMGASEPWLFVSTNESKRMIQYYCSLLFPSDAHVTSFVETLEWNIQPQSSDATTSSLLFRNHEKGVEHEAQIRASHFLATSPHERYLKLCTMLHPCVFSKEDFEEWSVMSSSGKLPGNAKSVLPRRSTTTSTSTTSTTTLANRRPMLQRAAATASRGRSRSIAVCQQQQQKHNKKQKKKKRTKSNRPDLRALLLCPVCGKLAQQNERYWIVTYPLMQPDDEDTTDAQESHLLMARLLCMPCLESLSIPNDHHTPLHVVTTKHEELPQEHDTKKKRIKKTELTATATRRTVSWKRKPPEFLLLSENYENDDDVTEEQTDETSEITTPVSNGPIDPVEPQPSTTSSSADTSVNTSVNTSTMEIIKGYRKWGVWRTLENEYSAFASQLHESRHKTIRRMERLGKHQQQSMCRNCKSQPATLVCGACKQPVYCSRPCQQSDWKRHRTEECRGGKR